MRDCFVTFVTCSSSEQLADWQTGKFDFGAGVFEEHDPFLMMQGGTKLDVLMSSPELEADACLICGSILVTIFVVHWTVCEKMDDGVSPQAICSCL